TVSPASSARSASSAHATDAVGCDAATVLGSAPPARASSASGSPVSRVGGGPRRSPNWVMRSIVHDCPERGPDHGARHCPAPLRPTGKLPYAGHLLCCPGAVPGSGGRVTSLRTVAHPGRKEICVQTTNRDHRSRPERHGGTTRLRISAAGGGQDPRDRGV